MSSIIPYTFPETGTPVRIVTIGGEPPLIRGLEGHVYIVEFNTGGIKVGRTANPSRRLETHRANAKNFGRRAVRAVITGPHAEAADNERLLINFCRGYAGLPKNYSGEYFAIPLEVAHAELKRLPQSRGDRAAFEQSSERTLGVLQAALGFTEAPAQSTPVFPWSRHLDIEEVDELVADLRSALEERDPLAAIDHVAVEWAEIAEARRAERDAIGGAA